MVNSRAIAPAGMENQGPKGERSRVQNQTENIIPLIMYLEITYRSEATYNATKDEHHLHKIAHSKSATDSPLVRRLCTHDVVNPSLQPSNNILPQTRAIVQLQLSQLYWGNPINRHSPGAPSNTSRIRIPGLNHLHKFRHSLAMRMTIFHTQWHKVGTCPMCLVLIIVGGAEGREERL